MSQTVEEFAALEEEQQRAALAELLGADVQIAPEADLAKMYEEHLAAVESAGGEGTEGAEGGTGDKAEAATKQTPEKGTAQKKPAAKSPAEKSTAPKEPAVKKGTNKEPLVFVETTRFSEGENKFFMKKGETLPPGSVTTKTAGALKDDGLVE